jgi:hypothetical protein
VVDVSTIRARAGARPVIPALCAGAAVFIGLAGWALLDGRVERAGWASFAAAGLLVTAGAIVRDTDRPREWVVLSLVDRTFDGIVLGGLVWVTRTAEPREAAGAIVALAAGFLAAYVRARAGSLGYGIEESVITPALRYLVISGSLIVGWTSWAVWVVAVQMLAVVALRATQVAKEERA